MTRRSVFEKPRDPKAFQRKLKPCPGCSKPHNPDFPLCGRCSILKEQGTPLPNDVGDPVLDNVDDDWDGSEYGWWRK